MRGSAPAHVRLPRPRAFTDGMFAVVDRLDADTFAGYYAEDAVLRFGNAAPVHGRDAIRGPTPTSS